MSHPFDFEIRNLKAADLDFEQPISDREAERVGGRMGMVTTMAIGEEGGDLPPIDGCPSDVESPPEPLPVPKPLPEPVPEQIGPPEATTLALNEEGGSCYLIM